jgi:ABC-type thiamine transport system ATPase subunit
MTTSVLNTTQSPGIASDSELRLSPASVAQPISRIQELEHLAQADWHIAEVKSHIKRQRLRVEHALETGQPSELLDSMFHAFEASLRAFQKHRELVLNQLKRRLSEYSD